MLSFSKDVIITFFTRVALFLFSLVSNIIAARILGPEGKGVVSVCMLIPAIAVLFASLDIRVGNVYFTGSRKYDIQSLINNSIFLAIIIGIIISGLLSLFVPLISQKFLSARYEKELYLSIALPFLIMLTSFLSGIMIGLRKVVQLSTIKILSSFFRIAFLFFFLYIFKIGILGAILASGLFDLFGFIMTAICIKKAGYGFSFRPQLNVILDLIRYSSKNYFGSIFQALNYRLDIFIIAYFLDNSQVGLYTTAVTFAEFLWYIPDSVSYILFQQVSSDCEKEESKEFSLRVIRITLFITIVVSIILFISVGWIIPFLFGQRFYGSINAVRILTPGIFALGLWKLICSDLAGRGLPQYKSYGSGIALVFTIVLDIVLIPRLGIAGAALASSIAYSLATILTFIWFLRILNVRPHTVITPTIVDFRNIKTGIFYIKSKCLSISNKILH